MKLKVLAVTFLLLIGSGAAFDFSQFFQSDRGDVALIELDGQIQSSEPGGFAASGITPDQIRDLNQQARQQNADAVIYEINSPGGAVVASKDTKRVIDEMEIPTICRLKDTAASGGYMMALGCDQIVADSATFTGSIGVTGSYPEFTELMDDLGINYVNVTAGEYKELGSPFRELSREEEKILEAQVESVHTEFYELVDQERNLTDDQLEEVRTGRIFLGSEAQELNMVDELGGRSKAIDVAENETGLDLRLQKVDRQPEFNWLSLLTMDVENVIPSIDEVQGYSPIRAER